MRSIHHAAMFTADYAATAAFYRDVFEAQAPSACAQPSVVRIGGVTLHVFEDETVRADWSPVRLHHIGMLASSLDEFVTIRQRLVDRQASDGRVQDFGMHASLLATDPDGGMLEVMLPPQIDRASLPFPVEPHV
jgi:hypothetical protein